MRRRFVTLDVFTLHRLAGNPLAVVRDADGLDAAAMQAVAREFNLSETVFVLPPRGGGRARLRIFTPGRELPFAGHPTVGTAALLALESGKGPSKFVLEEEVGPVACEVVPRDIASAHARFALPRLPEPLGDIGNVAAVAAALGLDAADVGGLPSGFWSGGVPFAFLCVRTREAVTRARPDMSLFPRAFGPDEPKSVFIFAADPQDSAHHYHARMFAPTFGIAEDPATGSAVAGFAGLLAAHAQLGDGEHALVIEQGYAMGRPSLIHLSLTMQNGVLVSGFIGGDAVIFSEGTIEA
ncbi:MAG: PhzF family phenazine biosynthesis protein [Pseudorhodoplanes sp.]